MVRAPTYGELLRTVADLMKENQAERAESRATIGAEHFVSIRTVMSTARKQAMNEFQVLLDAFTGNSWIPARP